MSPGDLLIFRSLSTTILQQKITGPYLWPNISVTFVAFKKKKKSIYFFYQKKTIKVKNMGKSNLFQPTKCSVMYLLHIGK